MKYFADWLSVRDCTILAHTVRTAKRSRPPQALILHNGSDVSGASSIQTRQGNRGQTTCLFLSAPSTNAINGRANTNFAKVACVPPNKSNKIAMEGQTILLLLCSILVSASHPFLPFVYCHPRKLQFRAISSGHQDSCRRLRHRLQAEASHGKRKPGPSKDGIKHHTFNSCICL